MSHSTNSGVALCLKPSNRRLKLSAASLKNQLRETHIFTTIEVEVRRPKRAVLNFNLRAARPVLRTPTSMVVKIGASALAKTKSHGELERAVAKFQRPTGSQILSTTTARIDYGENTRKYQRLVEMSLSTAWVPNTIDGRTEKESSPVFLQAIVTIRLPANCNKTGLLSFSRSLRSRLV